MPPSVVNMKKKSRILYGKNPESKPVSTSKSRAEHRVNFELCQILNLRNTERNVTDVSSIITVKPQRMK